MNKHCKRCGWEIVDLNLLKEHQVEVLGQIQSGQKMRAIQTIYNKLNIGLADSKAVVLHLNAEYGQCVNCDFSELDQEAMECPECSAFNYNLKIEG